MVKHKFDKIGPSVVSVKEYCTSLFMIYQIQESANTGPPQRFTIVIAAKKRFINI